MFESLITWLSSLEENISRIKECESDADKDKSVKIHEVGHESSSNKRLSKPDLSSLSLPKDLKRKK